MSCRALERLDPDPIVTNLTQAIQIDDYETIEDITKKSRGWCQGTNNAGYTALQEAIRQNKSVIFKKLLDYQDLVNLETVNAFGENAVEFAVNIASTNSEYYACALIEKGAFIFGVARRDNLILLHRAVLRNLVRVVKLLLEKGVNVNVEDSSGHTAVYKLLHKGRNASFEMISLLLSYGADPFLQSGSYNAFEMSVVRKCEACVQELLFYYTFDKQRTQLSFEVFLRMMKLQSPFLSCLRDCNVEYIAEEKGYTDLFLLMFKLKVDVLGLLLEKCDTVICNVLDDLNAPCYHSRRETKSIDLYNLLGEGSILEHLLLLMENELLRPYMAYFFSILDAKMLTISIMRIHSKNKDITNQLLTYYLSYGLTVDRTFVHHIYKEFGYGELFKLLLHLDYDDAPPLFKNNVTVAAIRELDFSLERFFAEPERYDKSNIRSLMDYFASPKFNYCFELNKDRWPILEECLARAKKHPSVPLLQEMARNVLRRYMVRRFNVKSTKEFYALVNALAIAPGYKKVITFETKLY